MFARELCIWARLQHKNILPLIGVVGIDGMPGLASEWMQNGTMGDYLKKHENADVHKLVSVAVSYCKRELNVNSLRCGALRVVWSIFTTWGWSTRI